MKAAKALCLFAIVVASIHFVLALQATGSSQGLGLDAFLAGYLNNPWQAVIGIDLMLGLMLACAWILWREPDAAVAWTWVLVVLWWGNLIVAIYLYRQLARSGGSWPRVLLGRHSGLPDTAPRTALASPWRGLLWLLALALAGIVAWDCASVQFAIVPSIGYVSGIGSLGLAAAMTAIKTRP